MGKITAIKAQRKNNKRFNVYIDGDFAFGVSGDVLIQHKLKQGMELPATFIDQVILAEERNNAKNYALLLLGYRARSEHEIRSRLSLKGYENSIIENAVQFLRKSEYIDDYAFARALVKDELNLKQSGKGLIKQRLLQKGISREISRRVLEETFDEEKSLELCQRLAEKKLKTTYKNDTQIDKTRKLAAFLQRRGYSYSMIRKAIETIMNND